jgi:hypothetical protein
MTDTGYDSQQARSFVNSQLKWLDNIQKLKDQDYLDVKYLALCSYIETLSGRLYTNEKNVAKRFKKIVTKYYEGLEFECIDLFYFNQASFLIGDNPNNPFIKLSAPHYYKNINQIGIYEKIKGDLENKYKISSIWKTDNDRYQSIESLIECFSYDGDFGLDQILKYIQFFNNANVLYHILRCPLVHQGNSILIDQHYTDGERILEASSMLTPALLADVIGKVLHKWLATLIEKRFYTYNYPGEE